MIVAERAARLATGAAASRRRSLAARRPGACAGQGRDRSRRSDHVLPDPLVPHGGIRRTRAEPGPRRRSWPGRADPAERRGADRRGGASRQPHCSSAARSAAVLAVALCNFAGEVRGPFPSASLAAEAFAVTRGAAPARGSRARRIARRTVGRRRLRLCRRPPDRRDPATSPRQPPMARTVPSRCIRCGSRCAVCARRSRCSAGACAAHRWMRPMPA